jgi:hypothetical protein
MSSSDDGDRGAKPLDLTEFGDVSGVYEEVAIKEAGEQGTTGPAQQNLGARTASIRPANPSLAPPPDPSRRRRRFRFFKRAIGTLVVLGVTGLALTWWAVHTFDWAGPLVADTLRAVIGVDNVTKLEDWVYSIEDRYNQWTHRNEAPQAYWEVPEESVGTPAGSNSAPKPDQALPPFQPADVGPVHSSWSAPGDGKWVPIIDARYPDDPPHMFKTLLHSDRNRSWAEVFVVAVDLRRTRLHMVPGYQEPKSSTPEAEKRLKERTEARAAVIPSKDHDQLLAAFNGGFKTEHGHYGMMLDGLTIMPPRAKACVVAMYPGETLKIRDWEVLKNTVDEMVWYRQTPNCMYENGKMHPLLNDAHATRWGATLDKETVIRRSAIGLNEAGDVLYVSITNSTTAQAIALGMHHAGAAHVAQLDVNWSYPKFLLYEPEYEDGPRKAVALAKGFEFDKDEFIRKRSMRDFFYLTRKSAPEARAWAAAHGGLAAPAPAPSASAAAAPSSSASASASAAPSAPAFPKK